MRNWDKAKLRETLDWIQAHVPQRERRANLISVETALIEELRGRKADPRGRHFLKFLFGNQEACHLMLRNVLRDPEVYSKHPEPEVAAAIMVCDKFRPQLQAILCNYAKVAQELDLPKSLRDDLQDCHCSHCLQKPDQSCFNGEGHVTMADTRNLKWPYLRTMVHRGRKFRIDSDMEQVFANLRQSLDGYTAWCSRGSPERLAKLDEWADAAYQGCRQNWARKVISDPNHHPAPQGHPGLREAVRAAHEHLVFIHDDRAPHGLVVVCKRWYMREMAKYLSNSTVFEACDHSWEDVERAAIEFNRKWGFPTGDGVVYNYGIWKPTKSKFRYIAGTRSKPRQPDDSRRPAGPPRQPLYYAHKELVRLLQQVENALREKDKLRQASEGVKALWGIDSIRAFTAMVRTNPGVILQHGQTTADFCTMYTAFPFGTMIGRTMESIGEAFAFWREKHPPLEVDGAPQAELLLGPGGWSYMGDGYTLSQVEELLAYLITHNYTCDGGQVRRQIQGMPMGMPAAPQIANLSCYPVEKAHAYALGPGNSLVVCRYIDDLYSAGVPLPPQEAYGMEYKKTAEGESVVYLGVKVYIMKSG